MWVEATTGAGDVSRVATLARMELFKLVRRQLSLTLLCVLILVSIGLPILIHAVLNLSASGDE